MTALSAGRVWGIKFLLRRAIDQDTTRRVAQRSCGVSGQDRCDHEPQPTIVARKKRCAGNPNFLARFNKCLACVHNLGHALLHQRSLACASQNDQPRRCLVGFVMPFRLKGRSCAIYKMAYDRAIRTHRRKIQ